MVVDTSALLALLFNEPHAEWVAEHLNTYAGTLSMSTVNLTETLIRLRDRQPLKSENLEERVLNGGIRFVSPNVEQAQIAAEARLRFPLNLGDCFAYALARFEKDSILTIDTDFRVVDVPYVSPL